MSALTDEELTGMARQVATNFRLLRIEHGEKIGPTPTEADATLGADYIVRARGGDRPTPETPRDPATPG